MQDNRGNLTSVLSWILGFLSVAHGASLNTPDSSQSLLFKSDDISLTSSDPFSVFGGGDQFSMESVLASLEQSTGGDQSSGQTQTGDKNGPGGEHSGYGNVPTSSFDLNSVPAWGSASPSSSWDYQQPSYNPWNQEVQSSPSSSWDYQQSSYNPFSIPAPAASTTTQQQNLYYHDQDIHINMGAGPQYHPGNQSPHSGVSETGLSSNMLTMMMLTKDAEEDKMLPLLLMMMMQPQLAQDHHNPQSGTNEMMTMMMLMNHNHDTTSTTTRCESQKRLLPMMMMMGGTGEMSPLLTMMMLNIHKTCDHSP